MPARENYLALPYGWRDILIGSEEALRWLGRSNLLQISAELEPNIKGARAAERMYASMCKRYGKVGYYLNKWEYYKGMPEAYEYTKALVLKSLAAASEKPILAAHRPKDYFVGAKYVYAWLDEGMFATVKKSGFRRLHVDELHAEDGYIILTTSKNVPFSTFCVTTLSGALLREEDIHYLCHDLNYAQFFLSFYVYEDSIFKDVFANLMRLRDRFPVPPDYLVESPRMPETLGAIIHRGAADLELERRLRRRDF